MEERKLLKRKTKAQSEHNQTALLSSCTDLAEFYFKAGRYDAAIEEYKTVANIYKSEGKFMEYAKANRGIGEAYMGLLNFEKALDFQKIYLNIATEENNKVEEQRALATIGHIYLTWYLETQNEPSKNLNTAYKHFMKSMMIAEKLTGINKLEKEDMMARLLSNLGLVKDCLGDYSKALDLLNRSISICKQNDLYEQLIRGYLSIASLFEKKNEYNEAIRNYNLAIDAAKKLKGNVDLRCTALLAKSEAHIKLADFHSAKQVLLKAYKLKTPNISDRRLVERNLKIVAEMCYTEDKLVTCDNHKELKQLYEKMGDGACDLKNYEKALEYYKLMLDAAEKSGVSGRDLASCYYSLAETYKDNGQFAEAVDYFEKEYLLCTELNDKLNTLSKIADTKEIAGDAMSEVKEVYERAFRNCRDSGNVKEERRMISRCVVYLRRNGCNGDAFELEQSLEKLQLSFEDDLSSSSDNESEDSAKVNIGDTVNLDELTDESDDSDIENQQDVNISETVVGKRKNKHFQVKKNDKGESQLHVACIKGSLPVVRHLLEQGHPVNVRDNSGWLPLHEACNHGYFDIVKLLLEKGAAINDRGGTQCEGITPLYDAASNGHLKIVELLLNKGASAIVKTDNGDTPLNIFKMWQKSNTLSGDDLQLYQSLVRRMTEAMKKAGQKLRPDTSVNLHSPTLEWEQPSLSHREVKHMRENYARNLLSLDDFDDRDSDASSSVSEVSVEEAVSKEGASEYRKVMGTLRNKVDNFNASSPKRAPLIVKRPALISSEGYNLDDWLEEDMDPAKVVKRRKTEGVSSLITPSFRDGGLRTKNTSTKLQATGSARFDTIQKKSQGSPKKRISDQSRSPEAFSDMNFEKETTVTNDLNPENNLRTSDKGSSIAGSKTGVKRKPQASLLDAGFSRSRSATPPFDMPSSSGINRRNSGSSFERRGKVQQQKLTSLGMTRSVNEADSTTVVPASQGNVEQIPTLPSLGESSNLMVFVDVKIEEKVFRVPVLLSQVQTNTIGWLAEQAASKYARKQCTKPTLELETITGALLSDDDPLSLLFPLGTKQAETVIGRVVKLSLPPLVERYKVACSYLEADVNTVLCSILEEMSISLSLTDRAFTSKLLSPLCKALNHQNSLMELDLSGNFLDLDCITKLCNSLPTLVNLSTLNLSCTGLYSNHLAEFVKMFTSSTTPILENFTNLDLSDNFLQDKSLTHLSQITKRLKLAKLNLSNVGFTVGIFQGEIHDLNLNFVENLDLSDNELSTNDIRRFMSWTKAGRLRDLNVSRNCSDNEGILGYLVEFLQSNASNLTTLDLSRCNIQENELFELLRLHSHGSLIDLNLSYNPNLTGITLRRLLECHTLQSVNLIGCDNILQYFGDCSNCDLLQDSDARVRKIFKVSCNFDDYLMQVGNLIDMFTRKYCDSYVEKEDNFLLLSSQKLND